MPLIETKGAASAQGFGLTLGGAQPVYIEDVFSTYLYTGNGSTQTITNGIDLSGKGGLTWFGSRNAYVGIQNYIIDSARGIGKTLYSYSTDAQGSFFNGVNSYNSNGVTLNSGDVNASGNNGVLWTFRKQPKFFDVVTYTGNGSAGRTISHNLGSYPGCIIVKKTSAADNWLVWHRSLSSPTTSSSGLMWLNTTNAQFTGVGSIYVPSGNTTTFTVASGSDVNQSGATYVAYLFAHDAGGFGLTGTDNVISCGSFTTDSSGYGNVTLGYEPQWVLWKQTDAANNWQVADSMRGWVMTNDDAILYPNTSGAEVVTSVGNPTSTGIFFNTGVVAKTFIYIAIRRGPMKVPTSGTSVFSPILSNASSGTTLTTGFPIDLQFIKQPSLADNWYWYDRLRGANSPGLNNGSPRLSSNSTSVEQTDFNSTAAWANTSFNMAAGWAGTNTDFCNFRRAPGFFDVVCYTGTGSGPLYVPHNLGVVPEFIIIKTRNTSSNWVVGQGPAFYISQLYLDSNIARSSTGLDMSMQTSSNIAVGWSSQLSLNLPTNVNVSGNTYVAYLFATCAGVSKVGSYTGTGALQTINCGFTGGARFVLIKRTDSTGDWYVYDSARGISSGNDPYLLLNSTAAEVTGTNYVDTTSVGFQVTAAAPAGLNANGGTYIFLAIA